MDIAKKFLPVWQQLSCDVIVSEDEKIKVLYFLEVAPDMNILSATGLLSATGQDKIQILYLFFGIFFG